MSGERRKSSFPLSKAFLSAKGYAVVVEDEEGIEEQQTFFSRDFERKLFSDRTNLMYCQTFMENALQDPLTGEIGKSIVYCVSQNHASKITHILNEFADR